MGNQSDDLRVESIVKAVALHNKKAFEKIDKRLDKFLKAFNKEFLIDNTLRAQAEALTWALFQSIISLYANQNNSAVIIELYSILEKFSMRDFPKVISSNTDIQIVIKDLIDRKNLTDIAPFYEKLGIWNSDDIGVINKLSKIRNGIAHKNEKLISKALNNGKEMHYLDIDSTSNNYDTCEYIIKTIKLFLKLSENSK